MSTVGIVVVSHSARLADAAWELAAQMLPGGTVPVRLAAGAGMDPDGTAILGTDATRVAGAIDELAGSCDGVLVLMDLGSAVMSAELALELRMSDVPVRLVPAPFVEGLLAATVTAAQGASLAEVAAEANGALIAKSAQLGEGLAPAEPASVVEPEPALAVASAAGAVSETTTEPEPEPEPEPMPEPEPVVGSDSSVGAVSEATTTEPEPKPVAGSDFAVEAVPEAATAVSVSAGQEALAAKTEPESAALELQATGARARRARTLTRDAADTVRIVTVRNPVGLHARPASMIVRALRGAALTLRRVPDGEPVPAASMMRLLALGASQGDEIELAGDSEAVQRIAALFDDGFAEMDAVVSAPGP